MPSRRSSTLCSASALRRRDQHRRAAGQLDRSHVRGAQPEIAQTIRCSFRLGTDRDADQRPTRYSRQRDRRRHPRLVADHSRRVAFAGQVLGQVDVARAEAVHAAVGQSDLDLA